MSLLLRSYLEVTADRRSHVLYSLLQSSGLSTWFGEQLSGLEIKSPMLWMACLTILASLITEITSNAATAAVILPVVQTAALSMKIHPLYFSIPVTIGVSFAFVLPVASPCVS